MASPSSLWRGRKIDPRRFKIRREPRVDVIAVYKLGADNTIRVRRNLNHRSAYLNTVVPKASWRTASVLLEFRICVKVTYRCNGCRDDPRNDNHYLKGKCSPSIGWKLASRNIMIKYWIPNAKFSLAWASDRAKRNAVPSFRSWLTSGVKPLDFPVYEISNLMIMK